MPLALCLSLKEQHTDHRYASYHHKRNHKKDIRTISGLWSIPTIVRRVWFSRFSCGSRCRGFHRSFFVAAYRAFFVLGTCFGFRGLLVCHPGKCMASLILLLSTVQAFIPMARFVRLPFFPCRMAGCRDHPIFVKIRNLVLSGCV